MESLRHSSSEAVDIGQEIQFLTVDITFGAPGLVAVAIEKHVPLRTDLETECGPEKKKNKGEEEGMPVAEPHLDQVSCK